MPQPNAAFIPAYGKSFALVPAEAHALGTPVLGTNIGGIPELIEDGKTGVLLPPGDTKALGAALCRLDLEPERLAAMTAACRADAFLSVQDYTDKLLSDYNA